MTDDNSTTSVSLLARIHGGRTDPNAWIEFVDRYGRRIYEWCIHRKLQAADAEDVTQNVLAKLAIKLESFEYDPSMTFRGWLRRITENALVDFFREQSSRGVREEIELLNDAEARADLAERLEAAFDLELFEEARSRVQRRVEPRRWRAWEMTAVLNVPGQEVATELNMNLPTVYSSRYQVQKMIADEARQLESRTVRLVGRTDDDFLA